ncbi:F-box protein CPR1-like [Bidens hawaiensis]|uniref:F-box protein CPR1-like n=1 Tax=Bidens hawaiensis TaxID=980011 RepID=UPI00404AA969
MANVSDDILRNILARLPGKPLLRFKSASKHWNRLISDPNFMKSRSRRMIILPFPRPLVVIDDNVPAEDEAHSMVKIPSPFKHRIPSPLAYQDEGTEVSIVGTLNGIVLMALTDPKFLRCKLILYNPLTCVSKVVMDSIYQIPYVFGFGYGETPHDLKIVRIEFFRNIKQFKCDVFDLKTNSWSATPQYVEWDFYFWGDLVLFLDGFLYWAPLRSGSGILALSVKEMVFSKIKLPDGLDHLIRLLGSIDGCLCVIYKINITTFDMWLMKDNCSWMKAHSFTFALDLGGDWLNTVQPICILGDGKVLLTNILGQLVIYDTLKHSHKTLNSLKISMI